MTAAFHDIERLEIAPGAGPFRIKGAGYKGHLEYVERYLRGGVSEMLQGFVDARQAVYFQQPFMHSSFYDIFPLVSAGHVCARQAGLSFTQFVRMRARYQAEKDLEGVYRALLAMTTPMMAIERLPAVLSQYLNPLGESKLELVESGHVRMERRQVPRLIARWFQLVFETYTEVVMARAGAKSVVVRSTVAGADSATHGYDSVRYRSEVLWT